MSIDFPRDTDRAADLRLQAVAVLRQLIAAREECIARHAERQTVDPYKHATGRSSLDVAIAQTEAMIAQLDETAPAARRDPPRRTRVARPAVSVSIT
ncbi:MAG: hypothetical protein KDA25_12340 [Phycisphaerales bacterium]|nr:hypothetical protein [Phycisphaerales bacterium]